MPADPLELFGRLVAAQNAHDVDAMVACFHDDYRSEQPLFPGLEFRGSDQVRRNWSAIFAAIRDFRGEVLRQAANGDTLFAEVRWTGTKADGAALDERGVFIAGVRGERIAWARLYVDEVHAAAGGIDQAVERLAGTDEG
jgi:ketosteroid isomerase-like protein